MRGKKIAAFVNRLFTPNEIFLTELEAFVSLSSDKGHKYASYFKVRVITFRIFLPLSSRNEKIGKVVSDV